MKKRSPTSLRRAESRDLLLAAVLFAAGSTPAFAQSSVDVAITGTLQPGRCTLALSSGGTLDWGQITTSMLSPAGYTKLTSKPLSITVRCAGPTQYVVTPTDNRQSTLHADVASRYDTFGLGLTSTGLPIGYYELGPGTGTADGVASNVIESFNLRSWINATTPWERAHPSTFQYRALGTVGNGATFVTDGVISVDVTPYVKGSNELALSQAESMDGNVTFTLIYL